MSDTFDTFHECSLFIILIRVLWQHRKHSRWKETHRTAPPGRKRSHPGSRLWPFPASSLCSRRSGLLSILYPTELTPNFSLCACSSYNPECSFSQLFEGLASHHSVFSSNVVFSERSPLTGVAKEPTPLPVHLSVFVFLIEVITVWNGLLHLCICFLFLSLERKLPCLSGVPRTGLFMERRKEWMTIWTKETEREGTNLCQVATAPTAAHTTPLPGTANASTPGALPLAPPIRYLIQTPFGCSMWGQVWLSWRLQPHGRQWPHLTRLPSLLTAVVAPALCFPLLAKDSFANLMKTMNSPQKNTHRHNKISAGFIPLEVYEREFWSLLSGCWSWGRTVRTCALTSCNWKATSSMKLSEGRSHLAGLSSGGAWSGCLGMGRIEYIDEGKVCSRQEKTRE